MRVRIHRGTREIGGNCIELSSGGKTLVLDMGMPLTAPDPASVKLPEIDGLQGDDHNFLGIVVSHPHFDHYGLVQKAPSRTRIFIGSDAEKILRAAIPTPPISGDDRISQLKPLVSCGVGHSSVADKSAVPVVKSPKT